MAGPPPKLPKPRVPAKPDHLAQQTDSTPNRASNIPQGPVDQRISAQHAPFDPAAASVSSQGLSQPQPHLAGPLSSPERTTLPSSTVQQTGPTPKSTRLEDDTEVYPMCVNTLRLLQDTLVMRERLSRLEEEGRELDASIDEINNTMPSSESHRAITDIVHASREAIVSISASFTPATAKTIAGPVRRTCPRRAREVGGS